MTSALPQPVRTWQQIAEEASHEQDLQKLLGLAKELEHALDECEKELRASQAGPDRA